MDRQVSSEFFKYSFKMYTEGEEKLEGYESFFDSSYFVDLDSIKDRESAQLDYEHD